MKYKNDSKSKLMDKFKKSLEDKDTNFYPSSINDIDESGVEAEEEVETKPVVAPPVTKPETRPSPIRRIRPNTDPRPKASLKNIIDRYNQLINSEVEESFDNDNLDESTDVDSLILGKTILEVRDLFDKLKYNNIRGMHDKKIVAADQSDDINKLVNNLEQNGYSVGKMQANDPRAFKKGNYGIEKWRNLRSEDLNIIDGLLIEQDDKWYALYFSFPEHASLSNEMDESIGLAKIDPEYKKLIEQEEYNISGDKNYSYRPKIHRGTPIVMRDYYNMPNKIVFEGRDWEDVKKAADLLNKSLIKNE